jgi:hypothetical protein
VLVPVAARSAPAAAQAGKANPMDPDASPARRPGTGSGGGREGHPVPGVPGLAPRVGGRGRRGRLRRRTAVHIGGVPGAFLPISLPVHARAGSVEAEAGWLAARKGTPDRPGLAELLHRTRKGGGAGDVLGGGGTGAVADAERNRCRWSTVSGSRGADAIPHPSHLGHTRIGC